MASSSNGNGHTGIQLGRGSTTALSDVRVERGQVSLLFAPAEIGMVSD